ncbi:hypothetical protein, partial [Myceligenerans indicum]
MTRPRTPRHPLARPGTIAIAALLLLLATAAVLTGALEWSHALAAATVAAVLVGIYRAGGTAGEDPTWPRRPETMRAGGRHEVSDLGWSMTAGDGRVKERVAARVRTLALTRLRRAGRDPDALGIDLHTRPTPRTCLLYTSDAADDKARVDLGG